MSIYVNIVVTLLFTLKCVSAGRGDLYEIPVPQIIVFTNGGIRITIPEDNGISEFSFHGNVNEEIELLRPGTINIETQKKTGQKWVLENRQIVLKRGDTIFYWIFVKKDRLGYIKRPNYFKVTELVPLLWNGASRPTGQNYPIPTTAEAPWNFPTEEANTPPRAPPSYYPKPPIPTTTEAPLNYFSTTPREEDEIIINDLICYNKTESITALQNQVESLTKTINILMGVLEKLPDTKKLTLKGRILQDENPASVVRFILWDKLDLTTNVTSAVRNKDGSITFEMKKLEEKILVLKLAQEKLVNSRISIVY